MLVTSSDVASIDRLLGRWEWIEYFAEAFVIAACIGEFIAEFMKIRTEDWRHQLAKISVLVLIAALAIELGALVRTNILAGKEIALLNDARVEIEERLIWEGPRDIPIENAKDLFSKRLRSFSGQLFVEEICGVTDMEPPRGEKQYVAESISRALIQAGWKVSPYPFSMYSAPCEEEGITVLIRSRASKTTSDAASALQSVLDEVLLQNSKGPTRAPSPPVVQGTSPLATEDIVDIWVGRHPLYPVKPQAAHNEKPSLLVGDDRQQKKGR